MNNKFNSTNLKTLLSFIGKEQVLPATNDEEPIDNDLMTSNSLFNLKKEDRYWEGTSKKTRICDMDTPYILNCIRVLNGKGKTPLTSRLLSKKSVYLKWFEEELKSRKG